MSRIFIILAGIGFILSSCNNGINCSIGSGPIVTEEIELGSFSQINFEVAGNVTIIESTEQKVVVESHQNMVDQINTSISDDTWRIRFRTCFRNYDKFNVTIYTTNINGILLSGSGNITSQGMVPSENLVALISGSGNITFETQTDNVSADISGSGNIILSGSSNSQIFGISGSGGIRSFDMSSIKCDITISGSGNCEVNASQNLDVRISGSGSVFYKGNPSLNTSISGSGQVIKAD